MDTNLQDTHSKKAYRKPNEQLELKLLQEPHLAIRETSNNT